MLLIIYNELFIIYRKGSIPSELGELGKLSSLYLNENSLNGMYLLLGMLLFFVMRAIVNICKEISTISCYLFTNFILFENDGVAPYHILDNA